MKALLKSGDTEKIIFFAGEAASVIYICLASHPKTSNGKRLPCPAPIVLSLFSWGLQGSSSDRGQRPVEWGDFPSISRSAHSLSVLVGWPSGMIGWASGLTGWASGLVSWATCLAGLALRPGWQALRPDWIAL